MITITEAKQAVVKNTLKGKHQWKRLTDSRGCVTAADVLSPMAHPTFNNSAMDGYAIRFEDFQNKIPITIIGESSAGKSFLRKIKSGEAVRIFTGAEVPAGTDTVVMQEKVEAEKGKLIINDHALTKGLNVRGKSTQILKGEVAIKKGTLITAGMIGFLASIGIDKIKVAEKPVVSIIVTGNELVVAGKKLKRGEIYESNSACLLAALQQGGITNAKVYRIKDDLKKTEATFKQALSKSDFIIFTGGISVGDYDFVGRVLKQQKVKTIFYKVKQRPGKPLYFGVKNKKLVFALPGNPASVLSCFYQYVFPAINKFQGSENLFLPAINLPLSKAIHKIWSLGFFLKAKTDLKTVTPLEGQLSYIMRSFAEANCMIYVSEGIEHVDAGSMVEVHLLPR